MTTQATARHRPSTPTNGLPTARQYGATTALPTSTSTAATAARPNWQSQVLAGPVLLALRPFDRRHELLQRWPIVLRHPTSHGLTSTSATPGRTPSTGLPTRNAATSSAPIRTNTGVFQRTCSTPGNPTSTAVPPISTRATSSPSTGCTLLPFGRGKALAGQRQRPCRCRSSAAGNGPASTGGPAAFHFSLTDPGWTTDWQIGSFGVSAAGQVAPPLRFRRKSAVLRCSRCHQQRHCDGGANPPGTRVRAATSVLLSRRSRQRNNFRGDGYLRRGLRPSQNWADSRIWRSQICLGNLQRHQHRALRSRLHRRRSHRREPRHSQPTLTRSPPHAVQPALRFLERLNREDGRESVCSSGRLLFSLDQ